MRIGSPELVTKGIYFRISEHDIFVGAITIQREVLYYVSNIELPSKRANTIQQVRMCQAFQRSGVDVCLLHPDNGASHEPLSWDDIADYYGLTTQFEVCTVPELLGVNERIPRGKLLSMAGSMTAQLLRYLLAGDMDESDIVYGRNYYGMFFFNELRRILPTQRRPMLVFERHDEISAHFKPHFFHSIDACIHTSRKLMHHDCESFSISPEKCYVAPNGVDLQSYNNINQTEARDRLGIPEGEKIVAYTGQLYPRKGVEYLVQAASELDAKVYIVGGYPEDIKRVKRTVEAPENVVFTGFVEPAEIPCYQRAADVLVAPNTEDSLKLNSPLKIFEYLAAGKPIVASDKEILKEVLIDGENALLVEPENVECLERTISRILTDHQLAANLATTATKSANRYSYEERSANILSFIREFRDDQKSHTR